MATTEEFLKYPNLFFLNPKWTIIVLKLAKLNIYFDWYFEAFKHYQESKTAAWQKKKINK